MAGRLTTHVLDTALGRPGAGIRIELWSLDRTADAPLITATTNADGRTDAPLLSGENFMTGRYELRFHIGPFFTANGSGDGAASLYDIIPIRFIVTDLEGHYHIPLLASPWSYTTYRGS